MNNTFRKVTAVSLSAVIIAFALAGCNGGGNEDTTNDTTLMSMAPADNNWRNALPSNKAGSLTEEYQTETQVQKTKLTGISRDGIKTFGSSGNDMFARVAVSPDGGFAAAGIFGSADGDCKNAKSSWMNTKSMIVKYNKSGEVEWSQFLGGNDGVTFSAIARLANGSYIVAGLTKSTDLGVKITDKIQMLLVCYSAAGKLEWKKLVGGTGSEYFSSVAATPDGGFVAGGKTDSSDGDFAGLKANCFHAVLMKYDSAGNLNWKRSLAGSKHNNFDNIAVNGNGDIFAACLTMSNDMDFANIAGRGESDTLIFKFDKNGTFIWVNSFSGSGPDELTCVAASPDGGCVIGGSYGIAGRNDGSFKPYYNTGGVDAFMVKYNKNGSIGWTKAFSGFQDDRITGIAAVNGGYAAVGSSTSKNRDFAYLGNLGGQDGFVLLVDGNGKTVNTLVLSGSKEDLPRDVAPLNDYKIVVVGGTQSSDNTFYGLGPAEGNTSFDGFTAFLSTSF